QCYPDVISNPPVPQRCLLTVSKPYRGTAEDEGSGTIGTSANDRKDETCGEGAGILYDMEAYGVYAAASRWFGQHAMIFFKVVSDFGAKRTTGADGEDCEENRLTAESVSELMSGHIDTILAHAESVRNAITRVHAGKSGLSDAQKAKAEALAEEMYFSASMKREFLEILNYAELAWNEAGHILEEISAKLKEDPCGNKNDGKRYLALARQMTEQR
ncbi:MAG: hypothetical protein ILP10_03925, partial [Lachnospiraceae bacterium]|nr:hypothetical protein [Lachnospiraceae bacterium]